MVVEYALRSKLTAKLWWGDGGVMLLRLQLPLHYVFNIQSTEGTWTLRMRKMEVEEMQVSWRIEMHRKIFSPI